MTAQDYVWSWQRALSPAMGNQYAYMLYPLENAEAFATGKLDDFSRGRRQGAGCAHAAGAAERADAVLHPTDGSPEHVRGAPAHDREVRQGHRSFHAVDAGREHRRQRPLPSGGLATESPYRGGEERQLLGPGPGAAQRHRVLSHGKYLQRGAYVPGRDSCTTRKPCRWTRSRCTAPCRTALT